ncbi:type II toxin-antitoxin system RelE/ParE family toxin [Candidatus Pantoea formicae]|uniref:type II toxin-antitoxin system RelE/ParE family toxin n=1 Tax=Candidatus Pantoea formicae TaxID=2608355 RepID=UPI003ED9C388
MSPKRKTTQKQKSVVVEVAIKEPEPRQPKDLDWRGTSKDDLQAFPLEARKTAGKELRKVQFGENPSDFKSINSWGSGVIEIRLDDEDNTYRVVYVAKFEEAIYVLHSFVKKTQNTSRKDVETIKERYKAVVHERSKKND